MNFLEVRTVVPDLFSAPLYTLPRKTNIQDLSIVGPYNS